MLSNCQDLTGPEGHEEARIDTDVTHCYVRDTHLQSSFHPPPQYIHTQTHTHTHTHTQIHALTLRGNVGSYLKLRSADLQHLETVAPRSQPDL